MSEKILDYLKYSGIWVGIVFNPYHWQFGWKRNEDVYDSHLFDNSIHLGPIWIRVIIDDGHW